MLGGSVLSGKVFDLSRTEARCETPENSYLCNAQVNSNRVQNEFLEIIKFRH